jgi:hypothetical protein
MPIGKGFQENVAIDEGMSPTGVRTIFHFEGDCLITQLQQDMEPALAYVQMRREQLAGQPWGEGREVGYIPELFLQAINTKAGGDKQYRRALVRQFFRDHPMFCYYDAYLKVH